jgi:aminoglycoside 6-adenylyltransferase
MSIQNPFHEFQHQPRPAGDVISTLIQWAMLRDPIRAVLLTSTRAIPGGEVDVLSDYDMILVVQEIHPLVNDHTWLNDFGEVLIAYWDPIHPDPTFGIDQCASVIQYCDGLMIDFTFWPVGLLQKIVAAPALPAELDAGYQVLVDKDHLADAMHLPTGKAYIPKKPTSVEYQLLINDFLSDAPYVAKCLWRGELMPAKWCLDFDMKHVYLHRMLEWRLEIDHDWSVPVGSLGKGLSKHLPPAIWAAVEQTYVGAEIDENWQALKQTMDLFRQVSRQVGDYFGYVYPDELHQRVSKYVEYICHMAPPDHS